MYALEPESATLERYASIHYQETTLEDAPKRDRIHQEIYQQRTFNPVEIGDVHDLTHLREALFLTQCQLCF
jgi:hypothetical protein